MHSNPSQPLPTPGYLSGQLLVATPLVSSPGFSRSVIFMCSHDSNGAMGIIINHIIENISYKDLFEQLAISRENSIDHLPVHYGGPVEINRGFVIYYYDDLPHAESLFSLGNIAVSSSLHILRDIAGGSGPTKRILALGYAGWAAGQLESELEANSWISVPASCDLVFSPDNEAKWQRAADSQGIDIRKLTSDIGHA
jgi:putative transcriptional regulator